MKRLLVAILLLVLTSWANAEKGRLPPPPETDYNSMTLDYIVTGAVFHEKVYSDNWTRSYRYAGKLDPSFGGVLRVTGRAQWLTYPGPGKGYPWSVTVKVRAGDQVKNISYAPEATSQSFDLSVPIGNAQDGEFSISMVRSSNAGTRNMSASASISGRVIHGPGATNAAPPGTQRDPNQPGSQGATDASQSAPPIDRGGRSYTSIEPKKPNGTGVAARAFADCLCRCSGSWAAHIGVFYDPDHQRAATCESMGPCIGGIGASGCSSRHFLTANAECSRACWDQAFPGQAFNPTTTQEFSDTLNQRYRQRRGVSPSK